MLLLVQILSSEYNMRYLLRLVFTYTFGKTENFGSR